MESPATSEEVRALVTVLWELASNQNKLIERLDTILGLYGKQPNDPRYKNPGIFR